MRIFIIKNKKNYIIISILGLLLLWQILALLINKSIILPSPQETYKELVFIVKQPEFFITIINTLKRVILGFIISFILALLLSFASIKESIYYSLKPLVTTFKVVPNMAIILLALIWLKADYAPILVGFLIIFPVLYESSLKGIKSVNKELLQMAKVYNINKLKIFKDIYLPSMKPFILMGINSALSLNLKIVIAAEVISQPVNSIGGFFQIEKSNLNTAGVFAWAVISIIIGGIFEIIISLVLKKRRNRI